MARRAAKGGGLTSRAVEVGRLGSDRRVVAVTGVEPGVVVGGGEHTLDDIAIGRLQALAGSSVVFPSPRGQPREEGSPAESAAGLDRGTLMGIDSEECLTCAPTPEAFNPASGEGHWWCDI